jgi:hypothetical protein
MTSRIEQFQFLSESNKNIDIDLLNENILTNMLGKLKRGFGRVAGGSKNRTYSDKTLDAAAAGSYAGAAWAEEQRNWQNYLANQSAQGPLGRLGSEYKEAAMKTLLAPYRLAPQALKASAAINLRRMGRGTPHSNIQYGQTEI